MTILTTRPPPPNIVLVAWIAFAIGAVAATGVYLVLTGWGVLPGGAPWYCPMGYYLLAAHVVFPMAEFTIAARYRPDENAGHNGFLLNHSPEYLCAVAVAIAEFAVEVWLVPGLKSYIGLSTVAFILCIAAYSIRAIAMKQAADNFRFIIERRRRSEHTLVTHGLYAVFRHPSYAGWFYFAVFSQLAMLNFVCVVLYAFAAWKFFVDRIPYEEKILASEVYFGEEYVAYAKRTKIWIPGIKSKY